MDGRKSFLHLAGCGLWHGSVDGCHRLAILELALIRAQGKDSQLAKAVGHDFKAKISLAIYAAAIPLAFVSRWLAFSLYVIVALIWVIPDPRIEKKLE